MKKGILLTMASAVIFGITPTLARLTYDGGATPVTVTFFRAVMALPVILLLMKHQGVPIRMNRTEWRNLFWIGGMTNAVTTILLYLSYALIPIGIATTLHFVYPIAVSAGCVLVYKDRLTLPTLVALIACSIGVGLFAGNTLEGGSILGFLLALASGFTIAFYMIYADKGALRGEHYLRITLNICVSLAICSGLYGLLTDSLTFRMTGLAWLYLAIASLATGVFGVAFLQIGIKRVGATMAAILSTFEPITSVLCGILILGEERSLPKMAGCVLILFSVLLISVAGGRKGTEETSRSLE